MADHRKQEMTRLGLYGLAPFWISALAIWIGPFFLGRSFGLDAAEACLAYGAVIGSYLAGIGAGGLLTAGSKRPPLLPGMVAALFAWFAIWPGGLFSLHLSQFWRLSIVLVVLLYLMARDVQAARAGALPAWYGELRTRLTSWAGIAIVFVMARLALWGFL